VEARVNTFIDLEKTFWTYPSYGWDWDRKRADTPAYYQRKLLDDAKWNFDQVLKAGEEAW